MAIVTQEDLKHEIVIDPNLRLVRIYRKVYGKNAALDFCHLFWGTVFLPILAIASITASPIIAVVLGCYFTADKVKDRKTRKLIERMNQPVPVGPTKEEIEASEARKAKRAQRWSYRILNWTIDKLSAGTFRLQGWLHQHRRMFEFVFGGIGITGLVGCAVILLYFSVVGLSTIPGATYSEVGKYLGVSLVGAFLFYKGAMFGVRKNVHREVAYVASRPAVGGWAVFKMGYRAVKTNTCPRITLKED